MGIPMRRLNNTKISGGHVYCAAVHTMNEEIWKEIQDKCHFTCAYQHPVYSALREINKNEIVVVNVEFNELIKLKLRSYHNHVIIMSNPLY